MFLKNHCKIITLKIANQDTVQFLGKNVDHFSHRREFDYEISNFGGCERLLLRHFQKILSTGEEGIMHGVLPCVWREIYVIMETFDP
jgi:hypothetical protein